MNSNFNIPVFIICTVVILGSAASLLSSCAGKNVPPPTAGNATMQSSVASSTALTTISGSDPTVQSAADATDADAVGKIAGAAGSVKGPISNIVYPPTNTGNMSLCFTGSHGTTVVSVPSQYFSKLPDMRNYIGKTVLVTGNISMGPKFPRVMLTAPDGIKEIQ